jgi:hypothetical protein
MPRKIGDGIFEGVRAWTDLDEAPELTSQGPDLQP